MFLNHDRKRVHEWLNDDFTLRSDPAFCPDCASPLSAIRGQKTRWHWRHVAAKRSPSCRMGGESEWHLAMKDHFEKHGFTLEVAMDVAGKGFRFDAYWPDTTTPVQPLHNIVEFVGSLSNSYTLKGAHLEAEKVSQAVAWVFSADNFVSHPTRIKRTRKDNGRINLLKPAAYDQVAELGFLDQACYVDHEDGYVHYKNNVWYPVEDEVWASLLRQGRPSRAHLHRLNALYLERERAQSRA